MSYSIILTQASQYSSCLSLFPLRVVTISVLIYRPVLPLPPLTVSHLQGTFFLLSSGHNYNHSSTSFIYIIPTHHTHTSHQPNYTNPTMAINVLDRYYLSITLLITIAYQLFFFCIAWTLHFDKLTDFAGGTNFVVLAVITLTLSLSGGSGGGGVGGGSESSGGTNGGDVRQILASLCIMLWGARLSGFLLFRILKTGEFLFFVFVLVWVGLGWFCSEVEGVWDVLFLVVSEPMSCSPSIYKRTTGDREKAIADRKSRGGIRNTENEARTCQ